jgi:hypothetical protein
MALIFRRPQDVYASTSMRNKRGAGKEQAYRREEGRK